MKNKIFQGLLVLAVLVFLGRIDADATLITLNSGESATFLYDGATANPVCSLCDASVTLTFNDSSLTVVFSNTSSDNIGNVNVLTLFAFDSTPDLTFSNPQFSGLPAGKTWSFQTSGLGGFEFGATSDQGITDGLEGGESGSLTVDISSPLNLTSLAIDATQTHFQSINVLGGTSTKPDGCVSGTDGCGGRPGGVATTATQVPEPSAIFLLGSGLFALLGARRRKRD